VHNSDVVVAAVGAVLAVFAPSIKFRACDDNHGTYSHSHAGSADAHKTTVCSAAAATSRTSTTPGTST